MLLSGRSRPAPRLSRAFRADPLHQHAAGGRPGYRAAPATVALAAVVVFCCCFVYITSYNNIQHRNPT